MSIGKKGWWHGPKAPPRGVVSPPAKLVALVLAGVLALAPAAAFAGHMQSWTHNHNKPYVPSRPKGLAKLKKKFGNPCNSKANDAKTWFPYAVSRTKGGYVYYHSRLALNVGFNIRNHISKAHKSGALDYGIYGYNCRLKTGGTSYSTHAWGAAIDTNTARNPYGQGHWVGIGADGQRHYKYIPKLYKGPYPGHRFYWGLKFSTPDPHHFQYVTGY